MIDTWGNRIYSGSERPYNPPKYKDADGNILNFAMEFFKSINSADVQNFVAAPLSPQIILSCLAKQSRGKTKEQIVEATGFSDSDELERLIYDMQKEPTGRELKFGNGIFVSGADFNK